MVNECPLDCAAKEFLQTKCTKKQQPEPHQQTQSIMKQTTHTYSTILTHARKRQIEREREKERERQRQMERDRERARDKERNRERE